MYKYSISGNTWATVAPTTARSGAPIAGMSANFVGKTGNTVWADITDIKDGRYIYSLRGGTSVLDRYDIAGGTGGAVRIPLPTRSAKRTPSTHPQVFAKYKKGLATVEIA